jgi:hypothetical protein
MQTIRFFALVTLLLLSQSCVSYHQDPPNASQAKTQETSSFTLNHFTDTLDSFGIDSAEKQDALARILFYAGLFT